MIVAHLSDLHLGFRAYGRVERGADVRERDVAAAWDRAVRELLGLGPDVVVVAGDVFDRPDPPAGALVALARGLELLRASLPDTPVLMVAGPRDTPRRPADPGALAVLDTFPNVEAAAGLPRSLHLERLDFNAAMVPYRAAVRSPAVLPEPDPAARWNVLVLHARVAAPGEPAVFVDPTDWDYVALGGEHRRRRLAPMVQYSGSLERVALDPWAEAADEKGFITVDLERGETTFHPIPGRAVAALAPIRVAPGDPERLRRRVREVMREVPGGINGKIVRLRLDGVDPVDLLKLQGDQLHGLRQQALHLAVEAGPELRAPLEAWQAEEAPRLLRDAVTAELLREGLSDEATLDVLASLVPEAAGDDTAPGPLGALESVDGHLEGLGRISTSISPGLTGVIGGAGRSRRLVARLLRDTERKPEGALGRLWTGEGAETLDGALNLAVQAVAEARGFGVVEAALERAAEMGAPEAPASAAIDPEPPAAVGEPTVGEAETSEQRPGGAVRVDPELVAAELRSAGRELQSIRADAVETDGDLQVAVMDWHRERQDAETTLNAYRDRARELRARLRQIEAAGPEAPCPMCGRVLADHHDEVLSELGQEWESVVQDGSWWKQRWEQLEAKPEHVVDLEKRSLRLHAALEANSERVELLRVRLTDLEGRVPPRPGVGPEGPLGEIVAALRRVRDARTARARDVVLARASRFVGRMSGGRILAVSWTERGAALEGDSGPLAPLSEEDLAMGRLALRLAGVSLVAARGQALASLVVEEPFDRLDREASLRTLRLLRDLLDDVPRIVLMTRGEAVDARPELFDSVLEVRDDAGSGTAALTPAQAGVGRLLLHEPAKRARRQAPRR